MKKKITLFLFLLTVITYSQNNERPVEYVMVEIPPVYKGCETQKSLSYKRSCSTDRLMELIDDNFDTSVSEKTNLDPGQYNVYVSFIVDKDGKITDVKTKGNDYAPFVEEATRLINSIPQYSSPGMQRGKIVNVRFSLPIAFIVEKETK